MHASATYKQKYSKIDLKIWKHQKMNMNREVHYEGWLIKSPPTKRIWRARWRRRWFTLKQGEIPEQFCLEYYTDRNCRKLKGVIDLDQCEQVDCGLRLENRKQKFQFMFDIKTPKRTYYLAADTEADMRDWVNCICQVCHLHDTKQSNDMQMDRTQNTASTALTNSTNNTTTTSLNSSSSTPAGGDQNPSSVHRQSFSNDILRRTTSMTAAPASVIDQQPKRKNDDSVAAAAVAYQNNNSDGTYVNTDYTNRDTVIFQGHFERHQLGVAAADEVASPSQTDICAPQTSAASGAVYLNSPVFQQAPSDNGRLVVSANGVVRKIPESLVLNNTPLPDTHSNSVQASPALSASSGPYIPISECFSGSPKFIMDSNNPTTPLNNLDPKFYDTPRCHNNIGLNLTNDQSYSPKITNCSVPQIATTKNRSDSDSESVFTDDDEWTHPLPLRENVDRSTRPSDSSVENESFVLTYTQRFSKMTEDNGKVAASGLEAGKCGGVAAKENSLEKLAKVLKNKNNLILDFIENGKLHRDMPQLSDTENTSPAIGPLDSTSVVEESYDIPRSQNLPYYNMAHLFEKMHSPQTNPIASSTPNLMVGSGVGGLPMVGGPAVGGGGGSTEQATLSPPGTVRTLPRHHCYTNAAPSKVEGNVFRYDFIEQSNLPPVNRKLKPKVQNVEDKPPEEIAAKPPIGSKGLPSHSHEQLDSPKVLDYLTHKFMESTMQNIPDSSISGGAVGGENASPIKPPSVDRKLKPNVYKFASPGASMTMSPSSRRSTCTPLSMAAVPNERDNYVRKTRTLPRHPPPPIYANEGDSGSSTPGMTVQHQRTASAAAAIQFSQFTPSLQQQHIVQQPAPPKPGNEHTLQYFDLDVANPPTINRQSMIVSNLYGAEPSTRAPSVVYIPVDFVKTEAFKRIREERKKESEGVSDTGGAATSNSSAPNK